MSQLCRRARSRGSCRHLGDGSLGQRREPQGIAGLVEGESSHLASPAAHRRVPRALRNGARWGHRSHGGSDEGSPMTTDVRAGLPQPPPALAWTMLALVSLAMFGNYYVYDS